MREREKSGQNVGKLRRLITHAPRPDRWIPAAAERAHCHEWRYPTDPPTPSVRSAHFFAKGALRTRAIKSTAALLEIPQGEKHGTQRPRSQNLER